MKKITALLLIFFVTACVSAEHKQVNTILSMARPRSIGVLEGKTTAQIRDLMGEPTFVRKEIPNESWVFKAPDCAVFVFFDENGIASFTQSKGSCDKKVARQILSKRAEML